MAEKLLVGLAYALLQADDSTGKELSPIISQALSSDSTLSEKAIVLLNNGHMRMIDRIVKSETGKEMLKAFVSEEVMTNWTKDENDKKKLLQAVQNMVTQEEKNIPLYGFTTTRLISEFIKNMEDRLCDTPKIITMGQQSSGKSSVLRRLLNLNILPVGNDTVTRFPIEIKLRNRKSIVGKFKCSLEVLPMFKQKLEFTPKIYQPMEADTEETLSLLLQRQVEQVFEDHKAHIEPGTQFIRIRLCVKIESNRVPVNLTLVDLPGIVGGKRNDAVISSQFIRDYLVHNPYSLFLCIKRVTDEMKLDHLMLELEDLEQYGVIPSTSRLIGVITHMDEKQQVLKNIKSIVNYNTKLFSKWHGICNPIVLQKEETINGRTQVDTEELDKLQHIASLQVIRDTEVTHKLSLGMKSLRSFLVSELNGRIGEYITATVRQNNDQLSSNEVNSLIEARNAKNIAKYVGLFISDYQRFILSFSFDTSVFAKRNDNPSFGFGGTESAGGFGVNNSAKSLEGGFSFGSSDSSTRNSAPVFDFGVNNSAREKSPFVLNTSASGFSFGSSNSSTSSFSFGDSESSTRLPQANRVEQTSDFQSVIQKHLQTWKNHIESFSSESYYYQTYRNNVKKLLIEKLEHLVQTEITQCVDTMTKMYSHLKGDSNFDSLFKRSMKSLIITAFRNLRTKIAELPAAAAKEIECKLDTEHEERYNEIQKMKNLTDELMTLQIKQ